MTKKVAIFENELNEEVKEVLTKDGLMKITENAFFKKIRKVKSNITLDEQLSEIDEKNIINKENIVILRKLPKIPYEYFLNVVTFFQEIVEVNNGTESFLQIFWNKTEKKYEVICPNQLVSGGTVNYTQHSYRTDNNMIWALDIHSHNTMSAFFSGTDNADEKTPVFYGVCGKLYAIDENIEFKFRTVVNGVNYNLEIDDVFELPEVTESVNIGSLTIETKTEKVIITPLKHAEHDTWIKQIKSTNIKTQKRENNFRKNNSRNAIWGNDESWRDSWKNKDWEQDDIEEEDEYYSKIGLMEDYDYEI